MKVGDTIWRYRWSNGPYREQWQPEIIVGETSRSWLVGPTWNLEKIPKTLVASNQYRSGWCFTQQEIDDRFYMHENRRDIAAHVELLEDVALLKQIAELVGYVKK